MFGSVVQVKDAFTSVFVVRTPGGNAIVVDAGFDRRARPTLERLRAMGLDSNDVVAILVTHGHTDHLRGANRFEGAAVVGQPVEQLLVAENAPGSIVLSRLVSDGERFEIDGVEIEAFAVPGHTAGSTAYLIDGVLIMGDTALVDRRGALRTVKARYSEDPEAAAASLQALRERLAGRKDDITALVCSHSAALADPKAFFRR